jgi:hypothetical protein
MKTTVLLFSFVCLAAIACRKNVCNAVTIKPSTRSCAGWAIVTRSGEVYPSESIPDYFKQDGIVVCAKYELYDDMTLCASCCGGTKANIITMTYPPE